MKALKLALVVVTVFVAGIAGFLGYMGMFSSMVVSERGMGPYTYAYEEFVGSYEKTMPVFDKVNKLLTAEGILAPRGIGVYFDNPAQVAADKQRSNCGSIIEEKDFDKVPLLSQKIKIGNFAQAECMVVEFPIKNVFSYMIAPIKTYTVLMKHILDKGYKPSESYEIYDMPNKKIYCIIPIKR